MSTANDKSNAKSYAEQLSTLESRLQGQASDEAMLAELGVAMRSLLSSNGESEAHIRNLLQQQYIDGNLRQETFELVQNLLGKIVTEEAVRSPLPESSAIADEIFAETVAEEIFATTAVIEDQAQAQVEAQALAKAKVRRTSVPEVVPEPAVVEMPKLGSVLRDRFLLKEQVSEGSMGTVYKALDRRLAESGADETFVAIKVLSQRLCRNGAALRALQQEAAKGRCLTHPNIVRFIDFDREDSLYFIVMEWLEGRSLSRILDESGGGALDTDASLNILQQVGRALEYAHQRGVIHADIKPGNVMITPSGVAKLIDFGVARVRQKENEGKSRDEMAANDSGTPAYSSMQVLTGEDPAPADDVFSLACLFYRLVAGYRVYGPRNAAQAAEDGMEPQQPPVLSAAQWQPLKKALSYSRVTRFQSPKAFVDAITGENAAARPTSTNESQSNEPVTEVPDIRSVQPIVVKPAAPQSISNQPVQATTSNDSAPAVSARMAAPVAEKPRPKAEFVAPIRAQTDSIMYEPDEEIMSRSYFGITLFILFALGAGFVALQTDWVDRIGQAIESGDVASITEVFEQGSEIIDAPVIDESLQDIAEFNSSPDAVPSGEGDVADDSPNDAASVESQADSIMDASVDSAGESVQADDMEALEVPEIETPIAVEVTDWSALPQPNAIVNLGDNGTTELSIREDAGGAIVDLVRSETSSDLTVILTETRFSGNRSPLATGIYSLENEGEVTFKAGQDRVRTTITMRSNPVRESDHQVQLSIFASSDTDLSLATLQLQLEDDDQRTFEEGLPVNTVAFAVNQISVQEYDPAAQIDVLRYNPDNTALEVTYNYIDVTATAGQDYFAPDLTVVYFAPGQRTARILIPLGQDARSEPDEAFMLELDTPRSEASAELFSQIAVMIRDDDT